VPIQHSPARAGEQLRSAVQIGKASRALGWEPAMPLRDGLRATLEWFAAQRTGARA
jgi:dTDP-D-glucose 4,6-dehydratase